MDTRHSSVSGTKSGLGAGVDLDNPGFVDNFRSLNDLISKLSSTI